MDISHERRTFMKLAGLGGAVFASGLPGWAYSARRDAIADDFYFVQLSDTHLGFSDPAINPDADGTLAKAVAAVNELPHAPDFVVFTGDLTHSTDDPVACEEFLEELLERGFAIRGVRHDGIDLPKTDFDRLIKNAAAMLASKHVCASLGIKPEEERFRFGFAA